MPQERVLLKYKEKFPFTLLFIFKYLRNRYANIMPEVFKNNNEKPRIKLNEETVKLIKLDRKKFKIDLQTTGKKI